MALPKKVSKIDLGKLYNYRVVDTSPFSDQYFNIISFPDRLTAGKNLFKLRANGDLLVDNSKIHIEILDYNGNPIYWEPLQYIEKDGTRVVSIYIFPDTSPGLATVFIAGRMKKLNGERIPFSRDFTSPINKDIPNVLWTRTVPIAPKAPNDTEIIFTTQPSLTITETIQPYLQPVDIFNIFTQQTSSLADANIIITPQPSNIAINTTLAEAPAAEGANTSKSPNFGTQFFDTTKIQSSLDGSGGATMDSPPLNTLNGFSKLTVENFPLTQDMIGGSIIIENAKVSAPAETGLNAQSEVIPNSQVGTELGAISINSQADIILSGSIKFAITDVLTSTTGRVAQYAGFKNEADNAFGPFEVVVGTGAATSQTKGSTTTIAQTGTAIVNTISSGTDFTASYIKPADVIFTENSSSFADIIIANTEPETGDVLRIKTLYKPSGFFGDFIDLGDTILERQNILIDSSSLETNIAVGTAYERYGNFESLQEIEKYWTSGSVVNGVFETSTPTNSTAFAYNENILIGGAEITPTWSPNQYTSSVNNATVFSIVPKYQPIAYKDTTYIVKFQIGLPNDIGLYDTDDPNINNNRLDVYISGSTVEIDQTLSNVSIGEINTYTDVSTTLLGDFANNKALGNRIGTIRCKNIPSITANVQLQFKATQTAPFDIKFVTRKGSWIVGEIEIEADKQTGFSPNYVRVFKRIPTEHLKTPLTFKFQYFDFRSNKADLETIAYGAIFNGGNTYIDGTENLMTGSVYIGNSIGSGIKMAGVSSGYVQSVGYDGFTSASEGTGPGGFLMWSGSSNLTVGADIYEGVGLELIANSSSFFRYRTTPAELIVQTETFFLGSDSQFISGANGNIEISSSNFHLTPAGDVTMSGTISATAGNIGDFQIIDGKISGSNITMDANDSTIYKTDQGPGSDTGAPFPQLRDEYYIDFTPDLTPGPSSTDFYIKMGPNFMVDKDGILIASGAKFIGTITASAGLIGGFTTDSHSFHSDNIFISGSPSPGGVDSPEYMFISTSNFNVKQDGDITGSNVLFTGGKVGGFTISANDIVGENIVIDSAGSISTADYASDLKGWKISAENNGFAEFENAKIRGTLATAVFEKETVNAVGGQLYVANSTVLTASADNPNGNYAATDTTMSVVNVGGFVSGEILSAKKVNTTGFSTEYLLVGSASRNDSASDTDFSGKLYVTRGYGSGLSGDSASLGDSPSTAVAYSGSQVIVSTGKIGTGFIRLNANPNNLATPYIDIVERTGSGIYDIELKARLGDLSGLANSDLVFNKPNPGFGLATDNVYLQGGITATFGAIGGFGISANTISSSNDRLILRDNGQITGSDVLFDGGTIGGFDITSDTIQVVNGTGLRLNLKSSGQITGSGVLFTGGEIGGFTINGHSLSSTGIEINDATQTLFISSSDFKVDHTGNVTASNALFDGNVKAVNFAEKIVTIDDANQSDYFVAVSGGKDIYLDGSQGGEITMNIVIDVSNVNAFVIKNIIFPNDLADTFQNARVIIQTDGMQFDDTTIGSGTGDAYLAK